MRRTFGIGLAVAVFAVAIGCGKPPSTSAPTGPAATGIEGGWTLVGKEADGKKSTEAEIAALPAADKKIKATADKLVKTREGKEEAITYKIDNTKTPNEVDLTDTLPNGTKNVLYGICKLEGDTLTICATETGKPADRPKEFKTSPGSKTLILTLKKD